MPGALYGLVGRTLSHSWSPQIHDFLMKELGTDGRYSLFPMEPHALSDFIRSVGMEGYPLGINITIPYKQAVIEHLGGISSEAAAIGAVNTIALENDKLIGYNTDYFGFRAALLRQGVEIAGGRALVLGSGGSARTAVAVLKDMGAEKIYVASRSPEKASGEFEGVEVIGYGKASSLGSLMLLVNTTPAGMHGFSDSTAIPGDSVPFAAFTFDLVYNPMNTALLRIAKMLGSNTQNGLYMLVAQAARAQEIWQGTAIPAKIIDKVYHGIREIMDNA